MTQSSGSIVLNALQNHKCKTTSARLLPISEEAEHNGEKMGILVHV